MAPCSGVPTLHTNRTQGAFATPAHLQTTIQRTNTHNITIYATLTQYIAIFMSVVTIPATEKHGSEKNDRFFFFFSLDKSTLTTRCTPHALHTAGKPCPWAFRICPWGRTTRAGCNFMLFPVRHPFYRFQWRRQ